MSQQEYKCAGCDEKIEADEPIHCSKCVDGASGDGPASPHETEGRPCSTCGKQVGSKIYCDACAKKPDDGEDDDSKAVAVEAARWRNPNGATVIDPTRTALGQRRALRGFARVSKFMRGGGRLEERRLPEPTSDVERRIARAAANARAVLDGNLPPDRRPPPVQIVEEPSRPARLAEPLRAPADDWSRLSAAEKDASARRVLSRMCDAAELDQAVREFIGARDNTRTSRPVVKQAPAQRRAEKPSYDESSSRGARPRPSRGKVDALIVACTSCKAPAGKPCTGDLSIPGCSFSHYDRHEAALKSKRPSPHEDYYESYSVQ
jgi:hypothetical protein